MSEKKKMTRTQKQVLELMKSHPGAIIVRGHYGGSYKNFLRVPGLPERQIKFDTISGIYEHLHVENNKGSYGATYRLKAQR